MFKPYYRAYLAAFLMAVSLTVGNMALPFFIFQRLGGGPAMSGGIGAVTSIGYSLVCLFSAPYLNRARNGLVWAVAGGSVFVVLFAPACLSVHPAIFASMVMIGGAGLGLFWPAVQSWLGAEPSPILRRRHIGMYNVSWSVGMVFGAMLGGPLFDIDSHAPFVATFLMAVAAVGLIISLPREDHSAVALSDDAVAATETDALSEGHMTSAWVANLTSLMLAGASACVFPKRVEELHASGQLTLLFGHDGVAVPGLGAATAFAVLFFAMAVARAVTFFVMGRTQWWHHRYWILFLAQCLAAGAMWLMSFVPSLVIMALCFFVIGVCAGITFFASIYYSLANRHHRHRRAAIHESMVGTGSTLGALGFGLLAKHVGLTWPFEHGYIAVAATLAVQLWLLRRGLRRNGVA